MTILQFGQGRDLKVDVGEPIGIQQGAGLHRLIVPLNLLAINNLNAGIPLGISGCAWLSMAGMEWLGNWQIDRPLGTRTFEFGGQIVLPLSDDQLAVIEKKRAGRRSASCSIPTLSCWTPSRRMAGRPTLTDGR